MIRIIMVGCNGKMGQNISQIVAEDAAAEIVAGVDFYAVEKNGYPVFDTITACNIEADVMIDFSSPQKLEERLDYAIEKQLPIVLCTTGLSEKQIAQILAEAGFDIEIIEKHHNQKVDAPSGTALALADAINEGLDNSYHYIYDRSKEYVKRDKKEIGISSVRGGTIVGEHDIIFAGTDEVIEISHTAYSKAIFGKGAVQAAKFLSGQPAGVYNMSDVIG